MKKKEKWWVSVWVPRLKQYVILGIISASNFEEASKTARDSFIGEVFAYRAGEANV